MIKHKIILLLVVVPLFLSNGIKQKRKTNPIAEGKWSGKVSFYEKLTDPLLTYEWRMDATITNDTGTVIHYYHSLSKEHGCTKDCSTGGPTELVVGIDMETKEYGISLQVQGCSGISRCLGNSNKFALTDETAIIIEGQPLGSDHNVLSGTLTETHGPDRTGAMTVTTYTWNLVRGPIDEELIITPQNYDNWLPEPGPDGNEWSLGNKMTILLRLQNKGGGAPTIKAKAFELRLSNTSKQPGVTLNIPLIPSDPVPDLSFLPRDDTELLEEGQFIKIPTDDGKTGGVFVGAFDGGGWTTLTAVTILESGDSIKGNLLVPGGKTEIPIPKRDPGSKIASAWLRANGNPGDRDDDEESSKNNYQGDGLTAYEEYRGFISQTAFQRFDPQKKELGIRVKRSELPVFSEGISWFENASGLKVIPFYTNEIDDHRWLNKNASYAHDYDQYVLKLNKGILANGVVGRAFNGPGIPVAVTHIFIDVGQIESIFQKNAAVALPAQLPYTLQEKIAKTVAHELSHGVNVWHHGSSSNMPDLTAPDSLPPYRIFRVNGSEIIRRSYPLTSIGKSGNQSSGDLSCIMAYTTSYWWAFTGSFNGSPVYYEVPFLPVGKILCTDTTGTGINAPGNIGINGVNKYFGNTARGKCVRKLRLR